MRYAGVILSLAFALMFGACASHVHNDNHHHGDHDHNSVEHIPSPDFPVSAPVNGQLCGGNFIDGQRNCTGANEYCHREIRDMCGAADAPGTCRVKPVACTMDYNPVCGCDGKTYSNECAANSNGASAAALGPCP